VCRLRLESAGPPEWSDSCDAFGAAVTARWPGPGWVVAVHTIALHEHPALVRTVDVSNLGTRDFTLTAVAVEALALRRDGAGVLTHGLARRSEAACGRLKSVPWRWSCRDAGVWDCCLDWSTAGVTNCLTPTRRGVFWL